MYVLKLLWLLRWIAIAVAVIIGNSTEELLLFCNIILWKCLMGVFVNAEFSKLLLISLFLFIIILLSSLARVCIPIWKQF